LAVDEADYPLAFMLIDEGHMQALFVDPDSRGTGIGQGFGAARLEPASHHDYRCE
jgi:GNAT superfamily N-acetyltransferase